MTALEYRAALERLGLSIRGARLELGISERTSFAYASGEMAVPHKIARLLELMIRQQRKPRQAKPCNHDWQPSDTALVDRCSRCGAERA